MFDDLVTRNFTGYHEKEVMKTSHFQYEKSSFQKTLDY